MKKRITLLFTLFLALVMIGCGTPAPEQPKESEKVQEEQPDQNKDQKEEESKEEKKEDKKKEQKEDSKESKTDEAKNKADDKVVKLKVTGTKLANEKGEPVVLKGLSTHGLSWFPQYVNEDLIKWLKDEWKINVFRLAMYTHENGGYCTDGNKAELEALIDKGVEAAKANDIYVVIDWHVLNEQNPLVYADQAEDFWNRISAKYKDVDNVIYEICNEPNSGASWDDVASYARRIIPVIRANDPDAVILVGTPTWSQDVDIAAQAPLSEFDNVMYSLHFYAATHKQDLQNKMLKALDAGLPIFVSEFGVSAADGNGGIDTASADQWMQLLDEHQISRIGWSLSNKNESSALFVSDNYTSPIGDDLSPAGKWFYGMLSGKKANSSDASKKAADSSSSQKSSLPTSKDWNLSEKNSWQTDGRTFKQFDVQVINNSNSTVDQWKIEIPFETDFEISDSWNGVYTKNGTNLVIENVSYNGSIPAGGSTQDVGFILSFAP